MKIRVVANLIVGLLMPLFFKIRWLPNVYEAIFKGNYRYYDFRIETLGKFLYHVYAKSYLIEYILSIIMVALPFQIIKDYYLTKKNARLSFAKKWIVLTGIVVVWIVLLGSFSNIWMIPWHHNVIYLVFAFGFGLFFTILLYFSVDRYTEKPISKKEE